MEFGRAGSLRRHDRLQYVVTFVVRYLLCLIRLLYTARVKKNIVVNPVTKRGYGRTNMINTEKRHRIRGV